MLLLSTLLLPFLQEGQDVQSSEPIQPPASAVAAPKPDAAAPNAAAPNAATPNAADAPPAADSASAEALRERIHKMRMDLLLGGDLVREAENQAVGFYSEKAEAVERRLDAVGSDLSERRATYDVVLERALSSESGADRARALSEAQPLRREIEGLEAERDDLSTKRSRLSKLIASVASRERERQQLVDIVESTDSVPDELGLPWMGIGLAPATAARSELAPAEDEALLADLLERDPVAARGLLYELDPQRYWQRFPLTPPADLLSSALVFPLPDLPEQR
jgi:hypothetical protein